MDIAEDKPTHEQHAPHVDAERQGGGNAGAHRTIDPELEKRVVRKLDWHVIPLFMALCAYIVLEACSRTNSAFRLACVP